MASQHKIVVYVQPRTRTVNIRMRGHGNALRLNLAGYNVDLLNQTIPATSSQKAYVTSVLNSVIAALQ